MGGELGGRVAVVTGASAGIGECLARELSAAGARLVINARRKERLDALAKELGADRVAVVAGDAADDGVISSLLDTAAQRFGAEADLVVVNAGRGLRGGLYDSDTAQWEQIFRTNLLGAARLMRAAAERMVGKATGPQTPAPGSAPPGPPTGWEKRPRDIVVIGSTVGRHLSPFSSLYGSAKAGVHMLAEGLRRTLGPRGVRVTLIEPGIVRSEFQGAANYDPVSFGSFMDSISPVLTPQDIAHMVMFIVGQPAGVHVCDVMIRPTRQEYP